MYKLILPMTCLVLAACQTDTPTQTIDAGAKVTCAGTQYQHLIGQPASAAQDIGGTLRVLNPGDMMTRDLREDRTNVFLDDSGVIERITCG